MRSGRFWTAAPWLLGAAYVFAAPWLWSPGREPPAPEPAHETYYVISHLHNSVGLAAAFLGFAGVYLALGQVGAPVRGSLAATHFGATFIGVNVIFLPGQLAHFAGAPMRDMDFSASFDLFNRISLAGYCLVWAGLFVFLALLIDALWRRFGPSQRLASAQ